MLLIALGETVCLGENHAKATHAQFNIHTGMSSFIHLTALPLLIIFSSRTALHGLVDFSSLVQSSRAGDLAVVIYRVSRQVAAGGPIAIPPLPRNRELRLIPCWVRLLGPHVPP